MSSYQYKFPRDKYKTASRLSYLYHGNRHTCKDRPDIEAGPFSNHDCLIYIMGIAIPAKIALILKQGPELFHVNLFSTIVTHALTPGVARLSMYCLHNSGLVNQQKSVKPILSLRYGCVNSSKQFCSILWDIIIIVIITESLLNSWHGSQKANECNWFSMPSSKTDSFNERDPCGHNTSRGLSARLQ